MCTRSSPLTVQDAGKRASANFGTAFGAVPASRKTATMYPPRTQLIGGVPVDSSHEVPDEEQSEDDARPQRQKAQRPHGRGFALMIGEIPRTSCGG